MGCYNCRMCGAPLPVTGEPIVECEYCGSRQPVPSADSEKKQTLFARANRLRLACEFDRAAAVYESIAAEFPEEAEASWGIVLCRYGIEYVDDPATGKKVPTCHRSSFASVLEDADYQQTLDNADPLTRKLYHREATHIEELREGILSVSASEKPYDIFICYKETDERGSRTLDSVLAQDLYDLLTGKGYRVFFSRISLEDKLGREYEPYIFAALNSAKVMLAVGTCFEHYDAVWVKNEWSRFLKLMEQDSEKYLIPCYKDINAYDMPKEFQRLQAQDLGKVGAHQDLVRGLGKLIRPTNIPVQVPAPVVIHSPAPAKPASYDVVSSIITAFMDYEIGRTSSANTAFRQILRYDATCAEAYLGLILTSPAKEQQTYRNKYKTYCCNDMSELEKKVFTSKCQNALLAEYVEQNSKDKVLSALSMIDHTPLSKTFLRAIYVMRDKEIIDAFIARKCDINCNVTASFKEGPREMPLLSFLVYVGSDVNVIRLVLECGANANNYRTDSTGNTYPPLADSIWKHKNTNYMQVLLEHGADPNMAYKIRRITNGLSGTRTPLCQAVINEFPDAAVLLLKHGADPNIGENLTLKNGELRKVPPIFHAFKKRQWDVVELLLKHKANPLCTEIIGDEEWPLLSRLLWEDAPIDTVKLALECGADPNSPRKHPDGEYMPLDDSLWHNTDDAYARLLVAYGANIHYVAKLQFDSPNNVYEEFNMLSRAVEKNRENLVAFFLEHGADANSCRLYRENNHTQHISILSDSVWNVKNYNIAKMLLKAGADPNYCRIYYGDESVETYSILSDCIWNAKSERMVKLLLEHGANPSFITEKHYNDGHCEKESLLHQAIAYADSLNMVDMLVEHGASLDCVSTYRGRDIPFRRYPYIVWDDKKDYLKSIGWKGPGFFGVH